ncbi:MAG: Na/Pi symporter [Gammaproteobacteria bacterium]|nr:Na/Pi symporter [Gammaproteobacteria bacterium]MDH4315720.1 Na/Pi symporter [Gammaproteobacteria bacterium]MDH5213446.1 Na/Pi symporter [Gammaproteobacteria bacterium]
MLIEFEIWRLAAGLGLFLFGMHHLEQALQQLTGRPFKVFLRQHTSRPVKGVLAGAVATAALQSSSVVSLLVMALVGTGIISLASAVGIVFGSNLGTTATGWIVATVGFKLDIEALALPLIAAGGLGVVWSAVGTRRLSISQFTVGLGLMFLGLEFMKAGASSATELFDPQALADYPPIIFLLVGLVITAIIQSSSATIMVTLSALYAAAIPLESAAAVAIGADLGTTITAILGALAGSAAKKRVAVALIIFNVVTDTIAFLALPSLLFLITGIIGINDPLFALVAFHSLFNLLGIILFLPFVGLLSRWLQSRFTREKQALLRHIKRGDTAVPEAAIENLSRETFRLIDQAAALNQLSFGLRPYRTFYDSDNDRRAVRLFERGADHDECYSEIKQLEGQILSFALAMQAQPFDPGVSARLNQIIPSIRNAVHAAKSIRDTHHDLRQFRDSANDHFNEYYDRFRAGVRDFYDQYGGLRNVKLPNHRFELLTELRKKNEALHKNMHANIYREVTSAALSETEISTLLNVSREIFVSGQSLLSALSDALLDPARSADFAGIPAT